MSTSLLRDPHHLHCVQDDMESFFHVILYLAVVYLAHDLPNVDDFMLKQFDDFAPQLQENCSPVTGGDGKYAFFTTLSPKITFDCKPLSTFFLVVRPWIKHWLIWRTPQHNAAASEVSAGFDRYLDTELQAPLGAADRLKRWESHAALEKFWGELLQADEWPSSDTERRADQRKKPVHTVPKGSLVSSNLFLSVHYPPTPETRSQALPGPSSVRQALQLPTPSSNLSGESGASGKRTRDDAQFVDEEAETVDNADQGSQHAEARRSIRIEEAGRKRQKRT